MRSALALIAAALAMLSSSAALAQEVEPEITPSQSLEASPSEPSAAPSPAAEEPAAQTAPIPAPDTSPPSSAEITPAAPPTGAGSSPVAPAPPAKSSSAAPPHQRSVATLIIVNRRAVPATSVTVLVGTKPVAHSGPLAPNTKVILKLPQVKGCRVSVVANFPLWYSAVSRGNINVCKTGRVFVRL